MCWKFGSTCLKNILWLTESFLRNTISKIKISEKIQLPLDDISKKFSTCEKQLNFFRKLRKLKKTETRKNAEFKKNPDHQVLTKYLQSCFFHLRKLFSHLIENHLSPEKLEKPEKSSSDFY